MSEYNIEYNYTFKNTDPSDAVKEYASEKITPQIKKFIHQDVIAHLVFDVEKNRQIAEISLNCFGQNFKCTEESESMYKSLDLVTDKISKVLRREKRKVTSH